MYSELFDEYRQEKMRRVFLEISKYGKIKNYKKNRLIDKENEDEFCIVVNGKLEESLYSKDGKEKTLYILQAGEIFGEMDYFCAGKTETVIKALEDSSISILNKEFIESILEKEPRIYRYIIHSITRKFRITMFQMANMAFSDTYGKVADTILRLYIQDPEEVGNKDEKILNEKFTHEEIGNLIGCSRVSVTRVMNEFKKKEIIDIKEGKILIKNIEKLKKYINWK